MGIFSGIRKFGLDNFNESRIYEDDKKGINGKNADEDAEKKTPEELEKEALFDKTYECPICNLIFKTKCVRVGKARLEGKDTDLRPIYNNIDPLKYDVITCDKCGYSAIARYWGKLATRQIKDISEQISSQFSGLDNSADKELYTYDDAIIRYQLALATSIVKKAKSSERAYTCLKYAWVLRGKRQLISKEKEQARTEEIRVLYQDEKECLRNAYEGFLKAISTEAYPIAGMDENTLNYVLADLARRLGRNEEALKLLGTVITSRSASTHVKDEALKLKELIRDSIKNNTRNGA